MGCAQRRFFAIWAFSEGKSPCFRASPSSGAVSLLGHSYTREGSGMTKNELAEQVARRNGLSASQARQVLESTIEVVSNELAAGGEVALAGFGKFSVTHRAARMGRNPSTGQTINIAASKAPKFSAASALKKRLNP